MPLKDVLLDELRDLYSAENQLVKAPSVSLRKKCHQSHFSWKVSVS
jgi:ferritin-like metal-binding protein YciE